MIFFKGLKIICKVWLFQELKDILILIKSVHKNAHLFNDDAVFQRI